MNTTDLRVVKTEQQIENAFLALLSEKSYRAITVQDILDKALINRSTFYRHYTSKAALAEKMVADFYLPYEAFLKVRFSPNREESLPDFLERITAFFESQRHKILPLWQIKTPTIHLYDDMYDLIKSQYISNANAQQQATQTGNVDFQGHLYASLMLSTLSEVLKKGYAFNTINIKKEINLMFETAKMHDN